jgi:hypothetical protein
MQHAITLDKLYSTKHKYLWEELELALCEGRKPDWERFWKALQSHNEQETQMEISAIKFKPPWKEQWWHVFEQMHKQWNREKAQIPDWKLCLVQALAPQNPKWQH